MKEYRLSALGVRLSALVLAATVLGACGGDNATIKQPVSASADAAAPSVTPTGKVVTVDMFTDATGNYYAPKDIEVQRGDVVRFVLRSGVHNVNFPADSNPGKAWLPKPSDYLQIPGQEFDLTIAMEPGRYYYHCDPHALLGMVGHITVKQ